jgi:WD40 repeat protein
VLNKVECFDNLLYCAYSNGLILLYKYNTVEKAYQYANKFHPYQNMDVIDIDQYDSDVLLTCSHNEVTLYNLTKNKSISLHGHESTPIAVSAHPVSPYVVSVSNAVIEHDLRMRKPINVNFITPPVYDIEFFPDGKEFLLSGDPCRIGRSKWIRALLNGIARPSLNSKFVLTNDMNGSISLWDWRESEQVAVVENVKNLDTYQQAHFGMRNGNIHDIYFFQDNGFILKYEILKQERTEYKLFDVGKNDNWKMTTRNIDCTTRSVIIYEHNKAMMKIYDL